MKTAKPNSMGAPQPCPSGHITVDKRLLLRYAQIAFVNFFYPRDVK